MIGILLIGSFSVATGFEESPISSAFLPSFIPPAGTNSLKEGQMDEMQKMVDKLKGKIHDMGGRDGEAVSKVQSGLASVASRQEVSDEKIDKLLKQMQNMESDTEGEEVSEMKSELKSVGLRQVETETKLHDISTKLDKVAKALQLDAVDRWIVWTNLEYYRPSPYSCNIAECDVKQQTIQSKDLGNLAFGKPAYGCKDLDRRSNPNHVVDGDKGGNRLGDQCFTSHASVPKPWWMVDLQGTYDVHNVTLYRRTDGYAFRFHDLEVLVFKENPMNTSTAQPMTCAQKRGRLSRPEVLVCNPSTTGGYVMLHYIPPNREILSICEVEVRGKLTKV